MFAVWAWRDNAFILPTLFEYEYLGQYRNQASFIKIRDPNMNVILKYLVEVRAPKMMKIIKNGLRIFLIILIQFRTKSKAKSVKTELRLCPYLFW